MSLPPEKILLRWMNFQLKKAGYGKVVTNFSSDVKVMNLMEMKIFNYLFSFYHEMHFYIRIKCYEQFWQCVNGQWYGFEQFDNLHVPCNLFDNNFEYYS